MQRNMFIIYVSDQSASRDFYASILSCTPSLDVPGMTEFQLLDGSSLGLMPESGIQKLLPDTLPTPAFATGTIRGEIYLVVDNPQAYLDRAVTAGARLLSDCQDRDWGDRAGYCLDTDGYVLGFATPLSGNK